MQRIRFNGIKEIILWVILPIVFMIALVVLDQLTKFWFTNLYNEQGSTVFIDGVLSFTYTVNTGSAFSFLSDKAWGQTFFKIITVLSLAVFVLLFLYSIRERFKVLTVSVVLIFAGTIGNFIDRLLYNGVTDFIKFDFINFPIFNFADILLTFGVVLFVVHFFFLDTNAVFKKTPNMPETKEGSENNLED